MRARRGSTVHATAAGIFNDYAAAAAQCRSLHDSTDGVQERCASAGKQPYRSMPVRFTAWCRCMFSGVDPTILPQAAPISPKTVLHRICVRSPRYVHSCPHYADGRRLSSAGVPAMPHQNITFSACVTRQSFSLRDSCAQPATTSADTTRDGNTAQDILSDL